MAKTAYEDNERLKKVQADQVIKKNKKERYYCSDPSCNAKLFFCDGKSKYFRTSSKQRHREGCTAISDKKTLMAQIKESDLDLDNLMKDFMKSTKHKFFSGSRETSELTHERNNQILISLSLLYRFLKDHEVEDIIDDREVGEILLDERSLPDYESEMTGYKIIEARSSKWFYDPINKTFKFKYATYCSEKIFEMKCEDKKMFRYVKKKLFENRERIIILAGEWEEQGDNKFTSKLVTKKQICFIRER